MFRKRLFTLMNRVSVPVRRSLTLWRTIEKLRCYTQSFSLPVISLQLIIHAPVFSVHFSFFFFVTVLNELCSRSTILFHLERSCITETKSIMEMLFHFTQKKKERGRVPLHIWIKQTEDVLCSFKVNRSPKGLWSQAKAQQICRAGGKKEICCKI